MYHLVKGSREAVQAGYVEREMSLALPMLSASLLTQMLERMRRDGELKALLAFDERLASQK